MPAGHGHSRGWDPRAVAPGALSSHPALCWLILPVLLVIPRTQLLDPAQLSFCTAAPAALGPSLPRVCTLGPELAISACNRSCYTMKGCARRLNCCFNRLALSNAHAHKTFRHLFPCPGAAGEQLECMQGSCVPTQSSPPSPLGSLSDQNHSVTPKDTDCGPWGQGEPLGALPWAPPSASGTPGAFISSGMARFGYLCSLLSPQQQLGSLPSRNALIPRHFPAEHTLITQP